MKCSDFEKHVYDLVDENINDQLKLEMEDHMESCASCREEYEKTRDVVDSLKKDAAKAVLGDKGKKGIKEAILKAPRKRIGNISRVMGNIVSAALIFVLVSGGIYFIRGFRVDIQPTDNTSIVQDELDRSEAENKLLKDEYSKLRNENLDLKESALELTKEIETRDWLMINSKLDEALIEGTIIAMDTKLGYINLNIYKDDNTPIIDPNIKIPDGVYITKPIDSGSKSYNTMPGGISDLKVGDHIVIHYIGKYGYARAILYP